MSKQLTNPNTRYGLESAFHKFFKQRYNNPMGPDYERVEDMNVVVTQFVKEDDQQGSMKGKGKKGKMPGKERFTFPYTFDSFMWIEDELTTEEEKKTT